MEIMLWLDFVMFLVLLGLFLYMFTSSSVTLLHRIYFLLHLVFMAWPLFQFAAHTASSVHFRLFFLTGSYVGLSLLGLGWFVFIIFLTGQSTVVQKGRLLVLSLPALVSVAIVVVNPYGMFLSIDQQVDTIKQLNAGPLYWFMIAQLILYMAVSVFIMVLKLRDAGSDRQRILIKTAMNGMFFLFLFAGSDLVINVVLADFYTQYIPLTSVGLAFAAIYLVHAIGRNKVFNIIQTVQRDVVNTMSMGIIVLDENDMIIEVNKVVKPFMRLRIGEKIDLGLLASQLEEEAVHEFELFIEAHWKRPLERLELELQLALDADRIRHVIIQSAPIMINKKSSVGRLLTFQDVTELRLLVKETNNQNELLQDRNRDLLIMQDELYQANKKLEHMAITDGLTGCYNRRYLLNQLELEVQNNIRHGISFSIFLFDLDHFKMINDRYGHLVGDEVLCSSVEAVRGALRLTDVLARYGGEEFTVYLPHTNREQADIIADMVMENVEQNKIKTGLGEQTVSVTISMGVVSIEHFAAETLDDPKAFLRNLMVQADAALYEAKHNGRNRIVKRKLA